MYMYGVVVVPSCTVRRTEASRFVLPTSTSIAEMLAKEQGTTITITNYKMGELRSSYRAKIRDIVYIYIGNSHFY